MDLLYQNTTAFTANITVGGCIERLAAAIGRQHVGLGQRHLHILRLTIGAEASKSRTGLYAGIAIPADAPIASAIGHRDR